MATLLPTRSPLKALCTVMSSAFIVIGLSACNNIATSTANTVPLTINSVVTPSPAVQKVAGDYVSEGYDKRAQGYDWMAVTIETQGDEAINIKVRARSDIKKPTCSFAGIATLMGQDQAHGIIFYTKLNDSMAFFQFKENKLIIDSQDKYALNRFCSGGGSIVGEYQKLGQDLALN